MRLLKVIKKEYKGYVRDKGYLLTMILEPLILMLVFGYTFQANITDLNTIVIDDDNTLYSHAVVDAIEDSEYFRHIPFSGTLDEAKELLGRSKARALFHIPKGFDIKLKNATRSDIKLYLDSSDYAIYNFLKGASSEVMKGSLQDIIQFIVEDLEKERQEKQEKIDEIQNLVNDVDVKANNTLHKVDNLTEQFKATRSLIKNTESKIEELKVETENMSNEVMLIKEDIETSKESLDELRDLLVQLKQADQNLSIYINPLLNDIDDMLDDIDGSLEKVSSLKPSSRISTSKDFYNIGEFNYKLDQNEIIARQINNTAYELKQTYNDVQERMDAIYLELRTLKKEFLSHPLDIERDYLFEQVTYFQYLTPAIMTLVLFFIGVMLTTINIVDERNNKTLFRISTTPLKKIELFAGKFLVFFAVGVVEVVYVLVLAIFLFDVRLAGSFFDAAIVLMILMAASIGLGLLISSIVKTMRQAVMLVPLVIIPSVLISQTFSPIEVMPWFMQKLAYLSPMFYSNVALREIMIKGTQLGDIFSPVFVLGLYAIVTLVIGVLISKKRIE